ncbi:MAG TPA: signal peptidase II [Sphingomonas sp.]|jgi:signal peptidase II
MRNLPRTGLITAAIVFVVDQITKFYVTDTLDLDGLGDERVLTSFFALRFVANPGVSLGLLRAENEWMRWALVALTAAIAAGVAVWMTRERHPHDQIGLGLVLGGAVGNIVDRVRFGYVVDFADLHIGTWRPFYIFNVADAAITIGVLILIVRAFLAPKTTPVENSHA